MTRSAVSIVLIVHNTAPWLKACFDSIAGQTFTDYEIVIVDVASGVRTKAVLQRHLRRFARVTKLVERKNVGGATAANVGVSAATGRFVFIMDSDDVLPSRALEALHRRAVADSLDVTIGRALTIVGDEVQATRYRADMITWAKPMTVTRLEERPELTMAPYYWGRLYRRQMLIENDVSMRPGSLFADRYFTCKALQTSQRTGVVLDDCYFWRRDRGQGTATRSITQRAGEAKVLRARVASFEDVESLFQEPADAALLKYVRLSNLMRLFIHSRYTVENEALRAEMLETVLPYAQSFELEEVVGCEFMLARHKVQWFLIVNQRWEDLAQVQSDPEPESRSCASEDQIEFGYDSLVSGLPRSVCRQFRFKVTSLTATIDASRDVEVHAEIPNGMQFEPLHVEIKRPQPDKDIRIPIMGARRIEAGMAVTFSIPSSLAVSSMRHVRLAFETRGRYSTQRIELTRGN